MDSKLNQLIELSRDFGSDPEYVNGTGGNTSFKDKKNIWVKASGIPLGTISKDEFVVLDRGRLDAISKTDYGEDRSVRDERIGSDLKAASVDPGGLIPSVETLLHNLFEYPFVVHTHPTLVNGMLCSRRSGEIAREIFGKEVLYIEYSDPGYLLFRRVEAELKKIASKNERRPSVMLLQNHGVVVGGDTCDDVRDIYSMIIQKVSKYSSRTLPSSERCEPGRYSRSFIRAVEELPEMKGRSVLFYGSELADHFIRDSRSFAFVSRPLTPDNVINCGANYLYMTPGEDVQYRIRQFISSFGDIPRVIAIESIGLIMTGISAKAVEHTMEVFINMMRVSFLSWDFGGPRFLTRRESGPDRYPETGWYMPGMS